ncbi:hypothetical protein ISS99_11020 [Dyella mobilis]|uniref:Tetratricopeptide repeat protein n=1 Tax=Dyella mobilis TaxID=1849582 RepID=A0ABS2KH27_9GAMM|nr:hypothetical protein [Dyella mobilis]
MFRANWFNGRLLLLAALCLTTMAYWPGLSGGWLFDDYPNIVDNPGVQPNQLDTASLVRAALSSPSSDFKRPLASLSFALNYSFTGLDPYWMKATNLIIHLLNGCLVFFLSRLLLKSARPHASERSAETIAAWVAASWLLLPINLTAVLYTVQRMESLANLFVLLGLIGYVHGRVKLLTLPSANNLGAIALCTVSLIGATAMGATAKETAVMLPLYAFLCEWALFGFSRVGNHGKDFEDQHHTAPPRSRHDVRIITLFVVTLWLPLGLGLAWLLPGILNPASWATRDFTLHTRLLTEARVVVDYIGWILFPTIDTLSFYHDDIALSTDLLSPWTTLTSLIALAMLVALALWLRKRRPLITLGIAFYLACHVLTATIIPLELVYEHRNYFASFGLMLVVVPLLAPEGSQQVGADNYRVRRLLAVLLISLITYWTTLTTITACAWGDPLRLAEALAARDPYSPRAQYELGRTYVIYSHYNPNSPFTLLAYSALEHAASIPGSSVLPEQALIFMSSRMGMPTKAKWWSSMDQKLKTHRIAVQDESSLQTLTECLRDKTCIFPQEYLGKAFEAALTHPQPSARLLAMYGDYSWNILRNEAQGEQYLAEAVGKAPTEPAYRISLIRMLAAEGKYGEANASLAQLRLLNIGGRLTDSLNELQALPGMRNQVTPGQSSVP